MDPLVVETLREIVKTDMRNEIETMRNSDQGCSEKCKLIKTALDHYGLSSTGRRSLSRIEVKRVSL